MKLTPLEIRKMDFAKSLRGYNTDEVRAFLEIVAEQVEAQAEHRVRPELIVAQTGYMQGAAGIGSALIHLHASALGTVSACVACASRTSSANCTARRSTWWSGRPN